MGSQPLIESVAREICSSRGGEFKETLDANEISRSEERNSSMSSWVLRNRWDFLREGAAGAARNWFERDIDEGASRGAKKAMSSG